MTPRQLAPLILANLRRFGHIGRHNAVSRHDLKAEMLYNASDRTFRRAYTSDICPVCVCDDGLFIPAHWYEIEDCVRYLAAHLSGAMLKRRAAVLTLAYRNLMLAEVGPLFESETEGVRV